MRLAPLALCALTALAAAPAAAGDRWPLWPSEVARAAEPLRVGEARNLLVVPEAHIHEGQWKSPATGKAW